MARETSNTVPNKSKQKKFRSLIQLLSHKDGPLRNWRFFPSQLLRRKLRSESAEIRAYAAEGLGNVGDSHAISPLIKALSDENITVRRFAITALGRLRDSRAIDGLLPFLQDDESDMRCAAVVALGELGLTEGRIANPPVQVIDALISSVTDNDRSVCSAAVVALGRIGNPQAISALNSLADNTESEWVRRYVSEALHQIEEQNA